MFGKDKNIGGKALTWFNDSQYGLVQGINLTQFQFKTQFIDLGFLHRVYKNFY